MAVKKYRKEPVVIDAVQFIGVNATSIINWILANGGTARYHEEGLDAFLAIDTLEGTMQARVDDWIIKGVQGEFYPCKPEIFDATYKEI